MINSIHYYLLYFACMRSVVVTCGLVTAWIMIEAECSVLEWMSIFRDLGFPSTLPPTSSGYFFLPLHKFVNYTCRSSCSWFHLQFLTCSSLVVQTYLADHDLHKLKTLLWDVEIHSYIYAYICNYKWPTHLHRTINNILHRLCKKYSCCKALLVLLLLLTSCEFPSPLHQVWSMQKEFRSKAKFVITCQQLVLISILLWFYKPDWINCRLHCCCNNCCSWVVVMNLADLITVFAEWPRICEIGL